MDPAGLIPIGALFFASWVERMRMRRRARRPAAVVPQPLPDVIEDCPPFPWRSEEVNEAIQAGIDAAICDPEELSAHVADFVYPSMPEGDPIGWPKSAPWILEENKPDAVQCLWERIRLRTKAKIANLEDALCPNPGPREGVDYRVLVEEWDSGEVPRTARWYQVRSPSESAWAEIESLTAVARMALVGAYIEVGYGEPESFDLADETDKNGRRFRIEKMASLIECAPINDAILGSPVGELGTDQNPGIGHHSSHLRGIAFNPVHAQNADRMARGLAPRRSVINGGRDNGKRVNYDEHGGYRPYPWIPMLDLERLEASPNDIVAQRNAWPNGLSGSWPPPEFVELGTENVPIGSWGCDPNRAPLPV